MSLAIKSIKIQNFKCFEEEEVTFAQPNGGQGSGLTVLIGDNGNGKTTVLEAINYLTQNKYSTENKLSVSDFKDYKLAIEVDAKVTEFNCNSSVDSRKYNNWYFKCDGLKFVAKNRESKERGKLLSSLFEIKNTFKSVGKYFKDIEEKDKEVDSRDLIFSNERIIDDEINIFYFDKNRTRQITTGNYKTTLERILDDLNWKFIKGLDEEKIQKLINNISGDYFKQINEIISSNPGAKLGQEMTQFFGDKQYLDTKLDLLNLLSPFTNASFTLRSETELKQKRISSLGSGVEMVLTLLLLRAISSNSNGSIIYLIDEPEMHLHPKAQEKFLELLIEESKDKQVVISTQSPYIFKGLFSTKALLLIHRKNNNNELEIADTKNIGWGLFGKNSPTWGEINYFAYDMPTVEFHNELYGHVQALAIDHTEENYYEDKFDKFLIKQLGTEAVLLDWLKELAEKDENGNLKTETNNRTIQTYIRNSIHHPENTCNKMYTNVQLKESTQQLIHILKGMK